MMNEQNDWTEGNSKNFQTSFSTFLEATSQWSPKQYQTMIELENTEISNPRNPSYLLTYLPESFTF